MKTKLLFIALIIFVYCGVVYSQPKADPWNGVCYAVKDYLKENANDPGSIKYVECSYISKFTNGNYGQRVKYRGKNAFGALVLNESYFIMSGVGYEAKVEGVFGMDVMNAAFKTGKIEVIARYDGEGKIVK